MTKNRTRMMIVILVMLFAGFAIPDHDAFARAGGGRSFGSSGSRSYSPPSRSYSGSGASQQQAPALPGQPAPAGGGFLRSMGGGILGGMLGGMLFSSLGFGGTGGGFGIVEILLICAAGYFLYTMIARKKKEAALAYESSPRQGSYATEGLTSYGSGGRFQGGAVPVITDGIACIRQMDPSFDENRFQETVMDIFFKIQGAWTNRNMATGNNLLTDGMRSIFQEDIDKLLREKKINKLDNIAVRKVEIVEAWQETGQDFIKALFSANLLDYTTDDSTGEVVAGSKTEPVKFEECWTFTRPVGDNPWKLSAISQSELKRV